MNLSPEERSQIAEAIRVAEEGTTGEIRVHIENTCPNDPLSRAKVLFKALGMHKTRLQNGVLVYIASESRKAAIYGDQAIAEKLPADFWGAEFDVLRTAFSEGHYAQGIQRVVTSIGKELNALFPADGRGENPDELSNEISFGSAVDSNPSHTRGEDTAEASQRPSGTIRNGG